MKDRVSYESQVLYVGPTGIALEQYISGLTPTQLHHIDSIEHSLETNVQFPYAYGSLNPLGSVIVEPLESTLEFEYKLADAQNEKWLGFDLSDLGTSAISGMLSGINDEQNFYIVTTQRGDAVTPEDTSAFLAQDDLNVMSFGNAVIENYSIEASLRTIPAATVSVNVSNFAYSSGASGIPAPGIDASGCRATGRVVIPAPVESDLEVDALRPANISLIFETGNLPYGGALLPSGGARTDGLSVCSLDEFRVVLELPRRINQRLGSKYPLSKPIKYPAQVLFSCSAKSKDVISGNLIDIFCASPQDIVVSMDNPNTESGNMKFAIKSAQLDTNISRHDLIKNEFINLHFIAPLAAPTGNTHGFYLSGVAIAPQETTYGITSEQLLAGTYVSR